MLTPILLVGVGAQSPQTDLLIRNVTVVSPERDEPLEDAWVAVTDGRIAAIGTRDESPPGGAAVVDGAGRFLTPGLLDGHVHLASIPGLPLPVADALRPVADAYQTQAPRSYLFHGFTTVVDLNVVDFEGLRRFAAAPHAPDVFHCGSALTFANGYPMAFASPDVRFDTQPNFLWDERQAATIPARFDPADHTPRATVGRVRDAGGICVKTHWEDGFGPQAIWPTPPRELIVDVRNEARAHGLTVTMHANSHDAYRFAASIPVDVIVHGLWTWDGHDTPAGVPDAVAAVLDDVIAQNIAVMPTTRVLSGERELFAPDFLDDPRLRDVLPPALLDWYRTPPAQAFKEMLRRGSGGGDDATVYARYSAIDRAQRIVAYLAVHDGRLVFGSDTPSAPTWANPPGLNGLLEMQLLAEAGVTPQRLFRAATLDVARVFDLDDRFGSIEVGKVANLLLLDADPRLSVDAWTGIETVILRGQPIARASLSARTGETVESAREP